MQIIMKLYLSTIGAAMLVIAASNILFHTAPWYYIVIAVIWCTALQFILDGAIAIIINQLPDRWFRIDRSCFSVSETEKKLYKKLKVRRWKDKVWELGGLGGFSKKNLNKPNDPDYLERFIVACNKGVVTHRLSYPIGFLAMLTVTDLCALTIALPVALVNLFLNILPTMALRYNVPKLQTLLERMKRRSGFSVNILQ